MEVVLAHVVAGVDDEWLVVGEWREVVLQGFDDRTGAQIRTSDADDDENVGLLTEVGSGFFDVGEQILVDF